ncbi:MAG TPA: pilus assembly protein TadG-related protein, partial [Candidatus Binataceae bacterium]|nr:pilus assembly protein TadG-related protein [Candidatus Binataceae bacterium]
MSRFGRGQTVVIFALIIPFLLGAISFGTDVAVFYFNWMQLQKAADAAALAGANYLPDNPATAQSTAIAYAESNGIKASEITATTVSADDLSISVTLQRTVPYYFARTLGLTSG